MKRVQRKREKEEEGEKGEQVGLEREYIKGTYFICYLSNYLNQTKALHDNLDIVYWKCEQREIIVKVLHNVIIPPSLRVCIASGDLGYLIFLLEHKLREEKPQSFFSRQRK